MAHIITADKGVEIQLAPETVVDEVIQNVMMILSTLKNAVPLDRNFGLPARFVDKPIPVAEAILAAEVFDAIEKYEPRAEIINISFGREEWTGKVTPRLEVEIHGG